MDSKETFEVPLDPVGAETVERLEHEVLGNSQGCAHYFVRVTDEEVVCRNSRCALGLFVNPTDRIVDGKLIHVA